MGGLFLRMPWEERTVHAGDCALLLMTHHEWWCKSFPDGPLRPCNPGDCCGFLRALSGAQEPRSTHGQSAMGAFTVYGKGVSPHVIAPTGIRERTTTMMWWGFDRPKGVDRSEQGDSAHKNKERDRSRRTGNHAGGSSRRTVTWPCRSRSGRYPVAAVSQRSRPVSGGTPQAYP
jgi:hypothetical protein